MMCEGAKGIGCHGHWSPMKYLEVVQFKEAPESQVVDLRCDWSVCVVHVLSHLTFHENDQVCQYKLAIFWEIIYDRIEFEIEKMKVL